MKKIISIFKRRIAIIGFTLGILLPAIPLIFNPINIQTDIFSLLPVEAQNPLKEQAFARVSEEAAQKIILLFANNDKETAHLAATCFYEQNRHADFMKNVDFYVGNDYKNDIDNWYSTYRYHLLSPKNLQLLRSQNGAKLQNNALRNVYSPLNSSFGGSIAEDPFLLFADFVRELPFSRTALFPYKDVLMAESDGKHYAFMAITIPRNQTFAITELSRIMNQINTTKQQLIELHPGSEVIATGVSVHSHAISKKSMSEINLICNLSLLCITLLIYFCFNSLLPFFLALFSIGTGFIAAFALTHLIFGEIHLITLIFGSSLIGVAVDYAFHFFAGYLNLASTNYNINQQKNAATTILQQILPGITLGLITSVMGYAALAFAPFPGLRQIACFSMIGLIVAYISVLLFYPIFYRPAVFKRSEFLLHCAAGFLKIFKKIAGAKATIYISILLILVTIFGLYKLSPNDDIRLLYSPSKELLADEILTRKVLNQQKASQFFLIEADSEQEVLEKEEALAAKLDGLIAMGYLSSYNAMSQLVPSIARQAEAYNLLKNQLFEPYLAQQAKALGISAQNMASISKNFAASENKFLTLSEAMQHSSSKMLQLLWLGKINGAYASVMLLNNVSQIAPLRNLEQEADGIYFMDKVTDISSILKKYRHISITILMAVYAAIILLLYFRYGLLRAMGIFLPPVCAGLITLGIFGLAGYSLNLFNILALFLVLGIGIDYTIFYAEGKKHQHSTSVAVFLSFFTTLMSFGILSVSSFEVVSSFGLVMLLGIFFVYLLSPLVTLAYFDK